MTKKKPKTESPTHPRPLSKSDRSLRDLFWSARLAHGNLLSGDDGSSCHSHREACDFAIGKGIGWFEALIEASLKSLCGHHHEAEQLLTRINAEVPNPHRCLHVFLRASLAYLLKMHDDAIRLCDELLNDVTFDKRGYAHSNMGESYYAKKQFDQAIACYQQALLEEDYDCPAYALNNLGRLHLIEKKNYPEAIAQLRKAVASRPESVRSESLYHLGCAYRETGDHEHAVQSFRSALHASATDDWHQLQSARSLLEMQLADQSTSLSLDDMTLLQWNRHASGESGPEVRTAAKIFRAKETQYDKYMKRPRSDARDELHILRGWSSAVTLIEGSERKWKGGGYFIKWKKHGIIVDPGFDFLRNFHDAGFHASEITAVIVTHNHPDHNSDLKSIDDLCYEVFRRREDQESRPYQLYIDDDTKLAASWLMDKAEHRANPVVLDHARCDPTSRFSKSPDDFCIEYFPVFHGEDVRNPIGFCLDLHDEGVSRIRLGFTGDTEYFDELPSRLARCDILVAHMSQPSIEELHNRSERKRIHLGYRGLIELIRLAKPGLTVIGEFWAGLEDLRIDLTDGVRRAAERQEVFPTSIGQRIDLRTRTLLCSTCKTPVPPRQVRVTAATELFGSLGYYCPRCTLGGS